MMSTRLLVIRARSQGSGCTAFIRLIVHPLLIEVPTVAAGCLHVLRDARNPSRERGILMGEKE
jgi:hypothetical protein